MRTNVVANSRMVLAMTEEMGCNWSLTHRGHQHKIEAVLIASVFNAFFHQDVFFYNDGKKLLCIIYHNFLIVPIFLPQFIQHINSHLHCDYPCYYLPLLQH